MNTNPIVTAWAHALRAGTYPPTHARSLRLDAAGVSYYGIYGVLSKVVGVEPMSEGSGTQRCPEPVRRKVTHTSSIHLDLPPGLRSQGDQWPETDLCDWGVSQFVADHYASPLRMGQVADLLDHFGVCQRPPLNLPLAA